MNQFKARYSDEEEQEEEEEEGEEVEGVDKSVDGCRWHDLIDACYRR